MSMCDECEYKGLNMKSCGSHGMENECIDFKQKDKTYYMPCGTTYVSANTTQGEPVNNNDPVNSPTHYVGKIECIDYLRDKLTPAEFTGFCMGNVLKYCSRWRKKDGVQDLHKALVYLQWAIENEEKHA